MGGDACGGRESQQEECNVNISCGEQTKYPLQASPSLLCLPRIDLQPTCFYLPHFHWLPLSFNCVP